MTTIDQLIQRAAQRHVENLPFHPERFLHRHVMLVTLKALLLTQDPELVLAGLFHDLFKPEGGEQKEMTGMPGHLFLSNPDHDRQAAEFVRSSFEVHALCQELGARPEVVADLCRHHMSAKMGMLDNGRVPRRLRQLHRIEDFVRMDDMMDRTPGSFKVHRLPLPGLGTFHDAEVFFIGVSPIQSRANSNEFTITFNRMPVRFRFDQIPEFFTGRFEVLREWMQLLSNLK